MSIITTNDVFNFLQVKSDIRTTNESMVSALITDKEVELENILGKKLESTTFTNTIFQHGLNCEIFGQKLYLRGIYRDIYTISSISEEGTSLSVVTDYNDGNDYFFDVATGILIRKDRNWSKQQYAIKMSGKLGLVNTTSEQPREDVKRVLIEMVASKSGLWKTNVQTDRGDITTIKTTISQDAKDIIKTLKHKGV